MPLTVAPALDFDSLVSLAEADAYWLGMGNVAWGAATIGAREAALRRATQYIIGRRIVASALNPTVIRRVREATMEAAIRALLNTLYLDVAPAGIVQKTVGPITIRYAGASNRGHPRFPVIDELLLGLTMAYEPLFSERV